MIVEVFGHAGAGKSLLVRRLAERLGGLGVEAIALDARAEMNGRRWPGKRLTQAWHLLRSPGLAARGLWLMGLDAARQPRTLGTLGGVACRARTIEAHASDPRLVLVDEGVLHGAWSLTLMGRTLDRAALSALLDRLPPVDCAISLRPPRPRIHANLNEDSDSRLAVLDRLAVSRLLDKQEALLDWLEGRVARRGRLHRIGETTDEAVEELAVRLAAEWRSRHRGGEPLRYSSRFV